jgi:hypothetical protein
VNQFHANLPYSVSLSKNNQRLEFNPLARHLETEEGKRESRGTLKDKSGSVKESKKGTKKETKKGKSSFEDHCTGIVQTPCSATDYR